MVYCIDISRSRALLIFYLLVHTWVLLAIFCSRISGLAQWAASMTVLWHGYRLLKDVAPVRLLAAGSLWRVISAEQIRTYQLGLYLATPFFVCLHLQPHGGCSATYAARWLVIARDAVSRKSYSELCYALW